MGIEEKKARFFSTPVNRRQVLKGLGLAGAAAAFAGPLGLAKALAPKEADSRPAAGEIPSRPLGKTGIKVPILCLGGWHLGTMASEADSTRLVHEAVDEGLTFMDNAWEYHKGRSEEWMGKALEGRREKVFVMTKVCTHGRDKKVAMRQLEQSLRRFRTDYLDLWQIHEVIYEDDPDLIFAPGGAIEALVEAKKQGKVRFIGFTGHKDPKIHLKMLAYDFPFDTCQMPLNVFDGTYRSFEREVLPVLNQRGIAPLAMKTLTGNGEPIAKGILTVNEALRYVLSLPVTSIVTGIDSPKVLRQNLDIARRFTPMPAEEMAALRGRMATYAANGQFESFKSSRKYDGPEGRKQRLLEMES